MLFRFFWVAFFLWVIQVECALYSKGDTPEWVKHYDFSLEPIEIKPSQVNFQCILNDTQRNWEEKTYYCHYAIKVLTQSGVEMLSQLNIYFDPSYNQVIMHKIRIYRDGQWFDRLETARHNLIQRETELGQNIYSGELTLVYFLDDVRKDDIIEYAYSLVGAHPLFSSHYTSEIGLQREFSIEKMVHRLLCPSDFPFHIKAVNTGVKPVVKDLSNGLREWTWEVTETSPYTYEPDQPIWYDPLAYIEMSQYEDWGEVAKKIYPLYRLPYDFTESVSKEMRDLVEKWKRSPGDLASKALLALRFVQDEIRYLGIEEGMGAFEPRDPCLVFERRYGDCKDKAFLLHALLHLMGISSKPLLVHSSRGKTLSDRLPNPFVFNHIVLQIEIGGKIFFVDPTMSLQGGILQDTFFPSYEWGLLISDDTKALIRLPENVIRNPTEMYNSFVLESEDVAQLKVKSLFYDSNADRMRRFLEWKGAKGASDEYLSDMQEFYGAVTLDAPLEVFDDREGNVVTLIESYRLPTQEFSNNKVLELFSYTLRNCLQRQVNPQRSSPYALPYPLWIKEQIYIESPFVHWKSFEENYMQTHDGFLYKLFTHIEKGRADFDIELMHLNDHILPTSIRDYWNKINEISQKSLPRMIVVSKVSNKEPFSLMLFNAIAGVFIWPLLYFFSRRKSPKQDGVRFHLNRFWKFYSAISTLIVISSNRSLRIAIIFIVIFGIFLNYNYITRLRSAVAVLIVQIFLKIQFVVLSYLVFKKLHLPFNEQVCILAVCLLYLGYSWISLNKVRAILIEEKRVSTESI